MGWTANKITVTEFTKIIKLYPFSPSFPGSKTHEPTEFIHVKGSNFEEQVHHFESVFRLSGFEVEKFSRLPYLCEGDLRHSYYVLTDAMFVLRVAQDGSSV